MERLGFSTDRSAASGLVARLLAACAILISIAAASGAYAQDAKGFRSFVESLWPEAQTYGVSRTTFDAAFAGVEPLRASYEEAVRERYRFYSYGDAMLVV